MRKGLFVLFLMLSLTGSAWTDMVGYWPLDGDATDASGSGNDGTISGSVTPTADRLGNPSGAMSFAGGGSDKIDVGDPPEFNITGAMTITAWVYLDSTSPVHGGRNSRILGKMDGGGNRAWSSGIEMNVNGVPLPATFQVSSNGSDVISSIDNASLPLDQWVHYAGVYEPGASMKVYLNGDLAFNLTTGVPAGQFSNNGRSVLIGNRPDCGNCGWYGALDEVRLYNEALSEGEIEALLGAVTAANPDPQDGALHVDPTSILSWDGPPSATSYDVYLGTDPDFAGETPVSDDQPNTWYAPDSDLQFATTYHWQIVVNKDGAPYEGPVWSFTTQGLASNPDPADGATLVDNNDTTLTWTGEDAVVSYDIYFGKNESAVASAGHPVGDINGAGPVDLLDLKVLCEQWLTSPGSVTPSANLDGTGDVDLHDFAILANDWLGPFQGNRTSTTFGIGTLDTNETYYWRIDEVFPGGTPTGAVWSFTTWAGTGDRDLGERTGVMWEFLEWDVVNPSWSGNAFDLAATVTFTHTNTGSTHTTEMFYDGSNTWKFRFTGTKDGEWAFTTTSLDPELNGYYGTVTIEPNPDPDIKGFLTYVGNKYAIQTGNSGKLEGYLLNIYMNQQDFAMQYHQDIPGPIEDISRVDDYFDDAVDTGFGVVFYFLTHQVFQLGAIQGHEHSNVDPDLETFGRLDYIIQYSHSRGERVHFWCWGDNARDQTPINLPGGINGYVDRRLQRYIAARLGPLPGWSMGYGYDLIEWAGTSQLNSWAEYMHDHFGWQHLLSSRGRIINGADNIISYSGFSGSDLTTTRYGPQDYDEIAEDLADVTRQTQPHLYEERHTYLRDNFNLDMDGSRRLIWWEAMAGGMGGFYGYYSNWFNQWGPFHGKYPKPEQFQTHRAFWRGRFLLDMERANDLTDGYCLKTPTNDNYVFYKENTNSVQMDLSGMTSGNSAVAVDTKLSYAEIDLGTLSATNQTWPAPYVSDWAIAVGRFER